LNVNARLTTLLHALRCPVCAGEALVFEGEFEGVRRTGTFS
jgi:hypothetical protein